MPGSEYDVAIAGAGPAGLQAARDIASRDYDVLVLETEPRDEFPSTSNKSTAGTFPPMMASFDIPDKVVQNYTERVVLESPNSYFSMDAAGAVMDFAEFKQYLVDECEERGAEFEFGARVNGPIKENGKVKGIRYNGDESVRSKVSIDATGPAAAISRELGLTELPRNRQAIGIEYEMRGVEPGTSEEGYSDVTDAMMLRLDHELAPGGYSWIFHTGGDTAKVGLCYIMNESFNTYGDSETGVESYMEEFVRRDPRLRDAEKMEGRMHRGSAHILLPDGMSTDGFMAVGDTVSSIDPVWGEGIHNCMKSGRAAAVTVDEALTPDDPDTSAEALGKYEERWDEEVGPERDSRMMVTELMYLMSNERYDAFVEQMDRMDTEALRRLNEGDKATILRMMSVRDLGLIGRWREMKAKEAEPDTKAEEAFRAAERRVGSLMDRVFSKG